MKKLFIGLLVVLILITFTVFALIPRELTVSKITLMHANESALSRYLSNESKWSNWWPEASATGSYSYNNFTYQLIKGLYNAAEINMTNDGVVYKSKIIVIHFSPDSVAVKWETSFTTSSNPIARILKYQKGKTIQKNMEAILDSLKAFIENKEKVYAFNIHQTTIRDTFLVSTKITTTRYPSTGEIYSAVGKLQKYIQSQGAHESNYPMLNVSTTDSIHYTSMVAIPTNKMLQGTGDISYKRMVIYKDRTVTAEVKGGPKELKKAYHELDIYMNDYNLTTPVIHWELLVTDRSKEADSSKWITKIFMPVV